METFKEIKELPKKTSNEIKNTTKAFESKNLNKPDIIKLHTANEALAGKKHPITNVEFQKKVVQVEGQRYEGVYPNFESKFDVMLPKNLRKASDEVQFKYCVNKLKNAIENSPELRKKFTKTQLERIKAGEPRIPGLTWHHHESPGRMQLVNSEVHAKTSHIGGKSIWGGGQDYR